MNKQNFIRTSDENTAKLLEESGFTFLHKEGTFSIFLNDCKMNFSDDIKKEILYTNMMNM